MYKCRLKAILADRGIKQKELAKFLGLTEQGVSKIINSHGSTSVARALEISEWLNMKVEDIWVKVEEKNKQ